MFTARSPGVARWAGTAAGVYCLLYGVAGALIGMAAKVLLPGSGATRTTRSRHVVESTLPAVLAGLVLAAALAAVMSTSSGALIATATVFGQDILGRFRKADAAATEDDHVRRQPLAGGRLRRRR